MLVTEDEYNKPINFKTKIVDDNILGLKFHNAIDETVRHILFNVNKIHTIKNGIEKVSLANKIGKLNYIINGLSMFKYQYPTRIVIEHIITKEENTGYLNSFEKTITHRIQFNMNFDIIGYIKDKKDYYNKGEYIKYFIKMTSLKSKNFKKKLTKAVYMFESDESDSRYTKMFNFLCNRFDFYINHHVNNYDNIHKRTIDPTKVYSWDDKYYMKGYTKILTKLEQRDISIRNILKN